MNPRQLRPPSLPAVAALVLASVALISGCAPPPAADVIAGDGVLCDISRRLAAGSLPVECLLGPNDDPHRFQLSPRQSLSLRRARLVLINGYGLTPSLARIPGAVPVAELAVPNSPDLRIGIGTDPRRSPGHSHGEPSGHDSHGHGEQDPHVWHDPRQAAAMVRLVSRRLQALNPAATTSAAIQRRERRMLEALEALHDWNQRQFATVPDQPGRRTLASGHRAFASLSRTYGLVELPVVDAMSSSESLRPVELGTIVQRLRRDRVPALFSEQWPAGRAMTRISELSGVPLAPAALRADGLQALPGQRAGGSGDLMATLTDNTCLIVETLGGRCDRQAQRRLQERWRAAD